MTTTSIVSKTPLEPFELLFETAGLPAFELPPELASVYGGTLGFAPNRLYANFVASIDGVAAVPTLPASAGLIAGGSEHDRFLMGLLRACADAVLIGARTLAGAPTANWTPEHVYPPAAGLYAKLRHLRDRPPQPTVAVLSGTGRISLQQPAPDERILVLTSEKGAAQLSGDLPPAVALLPIGETAALDPAAAVAALRERGHDFILCEGGPTLFAGLVHAGLVDELFLTLSPRLVGRTPGERRLSLLPNAELPSKAAGTLLSLRKAGSHIFLRYQLPPTPPLPP